MKLIFCGTPEFAVPTLRAVHAAGHTIALAVTQPDRPVGRGGEISAPPVKLVAAELGIPVTQPDKIRANEDFQAQLESIAPDAILVVAYGRIIPSWMLALPKFGNINLHASLLPKYRGAAPIQWSIACGETVTGNTTMRIDAGLDTGDILLQDSLPIAPTATAEDLFPQLADHGAQLMLRTLDGLANGSITPQPQDNAAATLAPILTREDGRIDFNRPASEIVNRFRGFQPWPGAFTTLAGLRLAITAMHEVPRPRAVAHVYEFNPSHIEAHDTYDNGRVILADAHSGCLYIACGNETILAATELQLEGRKRLSAKEFLRGNPLRRGEQLGE